MKTARTLRLLSAALLSAALLPACSDDFQPRSLLSDLRILAIEASPLEVAAGQEVDLRPTIFVPDGQAVASLAWKFCPLSLGPQAGFRCLSPRCELPLAPGPDGSVAANPTALATQCALALQEPGGTQPPGTPSQLPEVLETVFTLSVATDAGETREAVQRVSVWTRGAPKSPNRPPALAKVELDGVELKAGGPAKASVKVDQKVDVRVLVDAASLDLYADGNGTERTEDPIVSVYATAGRFDGDRTSGVDGTIAWTAEKLDPGVTEARMWVVVRDLRGGESATGPYRVGIGP